MVLRVSGKNAAFGQALSTRIDATVSAMIFRNSSSGGVNLVYRRADGHFGRAYPALADARRGEFGR